MFRRRICRLALTALVIGWPAAAAAQLTSLETVHLNLVFLDPTQTFLAPHVGRAFENSYKFQQELFDFRPAEKVTVLLTDFSDFGNGSAETVPRDIVTLRVAPLSFAFETFTASERMTYLMNHELVHLATSDGAARRDAAFRRFFHGKVAPVAEHPESILYMYLTSPRRASPRWYLEGIAVFMDTWMAGGLGRAQGPYDEMVFRSMVRDGSRFYSPLGLSSELAKVDFRQEANSYLYGTRFMNFLAYQYGPESVVRWVSRREGSRAYYASQFQQVFGAPLERTWDDWIAFEKQFQSANLETIREHPITPSRDLSGQPLGSVSRAYIDPKRRRIYAGLNYPGTAAYMGSISLDDGRIEHLRDIKDPRLYTVTSVAYDAESGTLFYTADNTALRDLMAIDVDSKRERRLLRDARIGDIAFNSADRSIWGIRTFNGICTLVRVPFPYTDWNAVYSWPYGETAYDLDVSRDGRLASVSVGDISGRQRLHVIQTATLINEDPTPVAQFDFDTAIPSNFVFSPDARYLYGSSYYSGVSNIFRYELATGKLDALTNSETGFFRPVPYGDHSLLVFRYTGEGFVPSVIDIEPVQDISAITFLGHELVEKHPLLKTWGAGSPASIPIESMIIRQRPYEPLRRLEWQSVYPFVAGYKDTSALGVSARLGDPVGLNSVALTAAYSPSSSVSGSERLHLEADYHRYDWRASAALNKADFYDLFGPTKTSRRGYSVAVGHTNTLIFDQPRRLTLDLDVRFAGHLDQLPDYQNVAINVDRLLTATANLAYSDAHASLGGVDDEKGKRWSISFVEDVVGGSAFTKARATYDVAIAQPASHSSVWLRTAAGFSPQDRGDAFANFYFGAFGNNYVDARYEQRYREYYALPGVGLDEISGRNFLKTTLDWNVPPLRFKRAGTPGFYLTWIRPSVFATTLATNVDDAASQSTVFDTGAQLDFRFTVLSTLDMTLSVGGALAHQRDRPLSREAMISLKVLR